MDTNKLLIIDPLTNYSLNDYKIQSYFYSRYLLHGRKLLQIMEPWVQCRKSIDHEFLRDYWFIKRWTFPGTYTLPPFISKS